MHLARRCSRAIELPFGGVCHLKAQKRHAASFYLSHLEENWNCTARLHVNQHSGITSVGTAYMLPMNGPINHPRVTVLWMTSLSQEKVMGPRTRHELETEPLIGR